MFGKVARSRGHITFERLKVLTPGDRDDLVLQAADYFALACAYLERFSVDAKELEAALRLLGEDLRALEFSEVVLFEQRVEQIQADYGLQAYGRLPHYLENTASLRGI